MLEEDTCSFRIRFKADKKVEKDGEEEHERRRDEKSRQNKKPSHCPQYWQNTAQLSS